MIKNMNKFDISPIEMEDLTILGNMDNENVNQQSEEFVSNIINNTIGNDNMRNSNQSELEEMTTNDHNDQVTNNWFFTLSEVPKVLKISEYDQTYLFSRIVDPSGRYTNKFNVFFKEESIENASWFTLNGVLTDRYVAASLEKFVEIVTNDVELINEPVIRREPWKSIWFGKTSSNIQYFDDEMSTMIFSLVTGAELTSINNISSNLSMIISNSYDGKRSLRVDYSINTSGRLDINNQVQDVEVVDYFSLGKFSHNVNHTIGLAELSMDLTSIQDNVDTAIITLKNYRTNLNSVIESISLSFKKESKQQFNSLCENLVDDYRSLYYVLFLASIVLGNNYTISEHMAIRSKIDILYKRIF